MTFSGGVRLGCVVYRLSELPQFRQVHSIPRLKVGFRLRCLGGSFVGLGKL
jgi:hypothetical protein